MSASRKRRVRAIKLWILSIVSALLFVSGLLCSFSAGHRSASGLGSVICLAMADGYAYCGVSILPKGNRLSRIHAFGPFPTWNIEWSNNRPGGVSIGPDPQAQLGVGGNFVCNAFAWHGARVIQIKIADWVIYAFGAILLISPASHVIRKHIAPRDRQAMSCETCGYDLRASPERCPECGEATDQAKPIEG